MTAWKFKYEHAKKYFVKEEWADKLSGIKKIVTFARKAPEVLKVDLKEVVKLMLVEQQTLRNQVFCATELCTTKRKIRFLMNYNWVESGHAKVAFRNLWCQIGWHLKAISHLSNTLGSRIKKPCFPWWKMWAWTKPFCQSAKAESIPSQMWSGRKWQC